MSTIFLKAQFAEGPTTYFAIDSSRIEEMNVSDTYDQYGQKISNEDAADYSVNNSASSAKADCEKAIEEKFTIKSALIVDGEIYSIDNEEIDYSFDDDSESEKKVIEINDFIKEWRKENETFTTCCGFTYWDGHNWKTITTAVDFGEPTHEIVDNENLISELTKALEEKEFDRKNFGQTIYTGNGYVIVDSKFQGTWAEYEIVPQDEFEYAANQ